MFQTNRNVASTAAGQSSPPLWPGAGPWWLAGSISTTSMWFYLLGSFLTRHLGGGEGVISEQSSRCWKADRLQLLLQWERRFYQRMVKELYLAPSNRPWEQPIFPSPSERGEVLGLLISESQVRERSCSPPSCLTSAASPAMCSFPLPQRTRRQVKLQ